MPQQEKSIIRSLLDPTIQIDSMELYDLDTGTSPQSAELGHKDVIKDQQQHKDIGTNYPFIEINNYVFNINEIEKFEISYEGFIPTVRLTAGIKGKTFPSAAMPKDGDLMSVFIRAKDNAFKPIRNDYRITNVRSSGADNEGRMGIYNISGELFIPHLYDEVVKYHEGTSYEVLLDIAKELGMGFASNDTATNDKQIWINPRGDYYNYILDIADHAWKDEQSFFKVFIDVYYHLNFVNVNNQFSEDDEVDLQLLTNLMATDSVGGKTGEDQLKEGSKGQIPKLLSNYPELIGTPAYVWHYNIENKSNSISELYGYKKYTQFFEQNSETYWSIFTDPLTTKEAEKNKIILKGRTTKPGAPKEEFWKTQIKHEWQGIQYTAPEGNCHEKYAYAKTWNERNMAELEKMILTVELERGNFNIYRGERLPVFFIVSSDNQYQNIMAQPEQQQVTTYQPQPILDKFNSGYYMVDGMSFIYEPANKNTSANIGASGENPPKLAPGFTHEIKLTRREWPTPI